MSPQQENDEGAIRPIEGRKLELETEKLCREREKLDVEIKLLRRPWFFQASYVAAILPIMALALATGITYQNSEWKRQAAEAEHDRDAARQEQARLREEIQATTTQLTGLQEQVAKILAERSRMNARFASLNSRWQLFVNSVVVVMNNRGALKVDLSADDEMMKQYRLMKEEMKLFEVAYRDLFSSPGSKQ
jgi:septal ring factor EnvC (AmiA/AmiB activator)